MNARARARGAVVVRSKACAGNSRVRFRIGIDPAGAEAELRSRKPPDNGTPGCSSPDAKAGGAGEQATREAVIARLSPARARFT